MPEKPELQALPPSGAELSPEELQQAYQAARRNLAAVMTRERRMEAMLKLWNEKAVEANTANGYIVTPPPE